MQRCLLVVVALGCQLATVVAEENAEPLRLAPQRTFSFMRALSFGSDSAEVVIPDPWDLAAGPRNIAIFTTAAMPWMTGTAVNPLLRAAHLARTPQRHRVTLCVPWVPLADQPAIFASERFDRPEDQERCMRRWARENLGFWPRIDIKFYDARYWPSIGSILATGDLTQCIKAENRDVAILEEPEHLNWAHAGADWTQCFRYVIGIVHTDYLTYRRNDAHIWAVARPAWATAWKILNSCVTRAYCSQVIKLSEAVQAFPKSVTVNVHGVRQRFLDEGAAKATKAVPRFRKGAYFIGKALWAKGYRQLVDLLLVHRRLTGQTVALDVYGAGPDLDDIKRVVQNENLGWRFKGAIDHAHPSLSDYKVLVNPSLSDVVCTTSAEALAMGKFVVCASHPSNRFFQPFAACFSYSSPNDFSLSLQHALASEPAGMTGEMLRSLSWEAATERLYRAAAPPPGPSPARPRLDAALSRLHRGVCGLPALVRGKRGWGPLVEAGQGRCEEEEEHEGGQEQREQPPPSLPRPAAVESKPAVAEPSPETVPNNGGGAAKLAVAASVSVLSLLAKAALHPPEAQAEEQGAAPLPHLLTPIISPVRGGVTEAMKASRRTAPVATQVPPGGDDVASSQSKMEAMRRRQLAGHPPLNLNWGFSWPGSE